MGAFVRRVKTASGATAVQIVHKRGRTVLGIEHIGSAHDEVSWLCCCSGAGPAPRRAAHAADRDGPTGAGRPGPGGRGHLLADLVGDPATVYASLGLDHLGDDAFKALVLARIIEPTSKADTVRVLGEIGVVSTRVTFMRCLKRVVERDYRAVIAQACHRHATRGGLAVVLYDVTTLHFEVEVKTGCARSG